jgi:hypothetical protein
VVTMAKDTRKLMVTTCSTYGDYFECFMHRMHKRMGHPLFIPVMLELIHMVEVDWAKASPSKHLKLACGGTFYTLAYTLALRGEEATLIELHSLGLLLG